MPKNLDRTKKHPAIVWVHGDGVNQNYDGWHVQRNYAVYYSIHQYFLQQGYVVIAADYFGLGDSRTTRSGIRPPNSFIVPLSTVQAMLDRMAGALDAADRATFETAIDRHRQRLSATGAEFHAAVRWPEVAWVACGSSSMAITTKRGLSIGNAAAKVAMIAWPPVGSVRARRST